MEETARVFPHGWTSHTSGVGKLDLRLDQLASSHEGRFSGACVSREKLERAVCPEPGAGLDEEPSTGWKSGDATKSRLWNGLHDDYKEGWKCTKVDRCSLAAAVWFCVATVTALQLQDDAYDMYQLPALQCAVSLLLACRANGSGDNAGRFLDISPDTDFHFGSLMYDIRVRSLPAPCRSLSRSRLTHARRANRT